jgi:membrane protein implicated in regulation of membrane protease activity
MELVVFWVLAGFILLAVELHAASFYAVFLALGSFAAALLAFLVPDSPIWAQAILAAVVSVVGLFALRPIASRTFLKSTGGIVSRGVHGGIVGEEALTVDVVGDEHHPGHVILANERWLAVTDNSTPLDADQAVNVVAIRGTTLLVRPIEHSASFDRGGTAMEGGSAMDSGVGNG